MNAISGNGIILCIKRGCGRISAFVTSIAPHPIEFLMWEERIEIQEMARPGLIPGIASGGSPFSSSFTFTFINNITRLT